jgi:ferredoxin
MMKDLQKKIYADIHDRGNCGDMKIAADTAKCVGSGQCVLTETALFDQWEQDGTVRILNDSPEGPLAEKAKQAVRMCPSQALSYQE